LSIQGPIRGGKCEIDGSVSSQLLTGLLMALPLASGNSEILVKDLKSRPYIDMTMQILKSFGIIVENDDYKIFRINGNQKYKPTRYTVEGDWSGGAFLLVAGAINGNITVKGLRKDSRQSDVAVLKALQSAGAKMKVDEDEISISQSGMKAFEFDATHSPDLFPPLVALACYCKGTSSIKGVSRLKHKESDRTEALRQEFTKLGIEIFVKDDFMYVTGGQPQGGRTESHEDHRIAMALAVASLGATGRVFIRDSQCVAKSYPAFFDDIRQAGVYVNETNSAHFSKNQA
jgi:3-phosphoshikimate 1-carboxyvinyltransferase